VPLLSLFLVLAGQAPVAAQEADRAVAGQIRGTVKDGGDRPLAGLLVQLAAGDRSGSLRITGTDEKGRYQFRDLPAGRYDVQIAVEGYRPETKGGIEVRPPFQNIVDFRLVSEKSSHGGIQAAGSALRAAPSDGAAAVSVRGDLLDQEKRPVTEVSVTLVSHEGKGVHQAFSGPDGRFAIEGVAPGIYRAVIASPGHVTLDLRSVEVPAGSGLDLHLTLVDYPLNLKSDDKDGRLPPEKPMPAPADPSSSQAG
jgi:hypothetical protein